VTLLVCGHDGQLAQALQRRLAGQDCIALGHAALDLRDPAAIRRTLRELRPRAVINAAAYTAVDLAEREADAAFALNATAPGVLAEEAAALGAPLIHFSTDYVFDGRKPGAYQEQDAPNPLGVYGRSKLAGERAVAAVGGPHLILRTSWVYSGHGRNFLLTLQRLLHERDEVKVVDDQIGAPTWAGDLADATARLLERWQQGEAGAWGLYHLTAAGETSWFGFAQAIAERLRSTGERCARLLPIPSSEYPTPASRPLNSRLDSSRLHRHWGIALPDWRDGLDACLAQA
jgi:dTDP-4-dehydrorhamnose reductase